MLELLEDELCAMNQGLLRVMADVKLDFSSFKRFLARIQRLENKYLSLRQWLEYKMATCHRPRDIHRGPTRRNEELKSTKIESLYLPPCNYFALAKVDFRDFQTPFSDPPR